MTTGSFEDLKTRITREEAQQIQARIVDERLAKELGMSSGSFLAAQVKKANSSSSLSLQQASWRAPGHSRSKTKWVFLAGSVQVVCVMLAHHGLPRVRPTLRARM